MAFPDTHEALKDLLNLTSHTSDDAELPLDEAATFISRHGPLRPFPLPKEMLEKMKADPADPRHALCILSIVFSMTFSHKGEGARNMINGVLAGIFSAAQIDGQEQPTALKLDIFAGTAKSTPRDLLDAIAVEFMRSFKTIRRCERCQRFFFRVYTSDRYCSRPCAEQSRSEAQRDWMRNYRAEQKRKPASKHKTRRTV